LLASVRSLLGKVPLVAWMVIVGLAIRIAVIPFVYDEWMSPYNLVHYEQGNVARALLAGRGFGSSLVSTQISAMMTPVFPLLLALIFRIFGVHTLSAMIATLSLNCLFSSLACLPVYLIARRSFGARAALWAGWGWALSPYGIYFSAEWAWSTHLLLLCLCWLFYLAQSMEHSASLKLWAGFALLAGFAGLTEPVILPIVPFLMALAAWRLRRAGKRWFTPGLVASLVLAASISPWIVRNAVVFHRFIPMRDSMGLELWLGNNGFTHHWVNADHHPNHDAKEEAEYNKGELAYMDRKQQQAKEYIHAHPGWYAWMCGRRALYLWTGYWSFDPSYLAEEPLDVANVPVATALSLLAFVGIFLVWKRDRYEAIRYGGVLFIFPLMYCFTHLQAYYMRPIDPLIEILGCSAILTLRGAHAVAEEEVLDLPETVPAEA
jgi:4-amino-4-deoxy-L-arabinose transferase-like glycosyltransferase